MDWTRTFVEAAGASAAPSHLGGHGMPAAAPAPVPAPAAAAAPAPVLQTPAVPITTAAPATAGALPPWSHEAERELGKIPFFVRGKAKRNTEKYAADRGVTQISVDTLYEAKAHYAR